MVRMPAEGRQVRAGAVSRNLLLAVVAAVGAIVGAGAYGFFFRDPGAVRREEGMHFECARCGHPFVKPPKELTLAELNTRPAALRVACPQCGEAAAAIPTVACPQCGKRFIPASYRRAAAEGAGRPKDVCPHCQTDRDQWYRDYYRRNR